MGMRTSIDGFVPPNEKFKKMLTIYEACESAGVKIPKEVETFFNGQLPDSKGIVIHLPADKHPAVTAWQDDMAEGFEVELDKLPKSIKVLRFYNSW